MLLSKRLVSLLCLSRKQSIQLRDKIGQNAAISTPLPFLSQQQFLSGQFPTHSHSHLMINRNRVFLSSSSSSSSSSFSSPLLSSRFLCPSPSSTLTLPSSYSSSSSSSSFSSSSISQRSSPLETETTSEQQGPGKLPKLLTASCSPTLLRPSTPPLTTDALEQRKQDESEAEASIREPQKSRRRSIGELLEMAGSLGKARLGSVVVATTALGFMMAPSAPTATLLSQLISFSLCGTGTALAVLSAHAGNQILEKDVDAKMLRTKNRLLPTKRLSVQQALLFSVVTGVVGPLMVLQTDPTAALLAAANIGLYVGVYTPLKQMHPVNTWIGAVVGAIPPLIGWSAATGGHLGLGAWILAALLYLWQMPHFLALSWPLRHDYARGGFRMLSNVNPYAVPTQILFHTFLLSLLPFISTWSGLTTSWFLLDSSILNAAFLWASYKFLLDLTDASAWRVFRHSIWYILVISILFVIHRQPPPPSSTSTTDEIEN